MIERVEGFMKKDPVLCISFLCAAVSMTVVLPSAQYMDYIDFKTIICLFCLMITVKAYEEEGLLQRIANAILRKVDTTRKLTLALVGICFFSSMLITNDVALIAFVPLTLSVLRMAKREDLSAFVVVLQTIAANIGSSLTPIGNPQNLYLYFHYEMGISRLIGIMTPYVMLGGLLLLVFCACKKNEPMEMPAVMKEIDPNRKQLVGITLLFGLSLLAVFGIVPYVAVLLIVVVGFLVLKPSLLKKVDYSLLLTFCFIFIFVGNMSSLESIRQFLGVLASRNTLLSAILASQLISNVPTAILLSNFTGNGEELLIGVSIGGLGTMIASMASVISYKFYANSHQQSMKQYISLFGIYNVIILAALILLNVEILYFHL